MIVKLMKCAQGQSGETDECINHEAILCPQDCNRHTAATERPKSLPDYLEQDNMLLSDEPVLQRMMSNKKERSN
jgi:hypothetical protein